MKLLWILIWMGFFQGCVLSQHGFAQPSEVLGLVVPGPEDQLRSNTVTINNMQLPKHVVDDDISFRASPHLFISIPVATGQTPTIKILLLGPYQAKGWIMGLGLDGKYDPLIRVDYGLAQKYPLPPIQLSQFMAKLHIWDTVLGYHQIEIEILEAPQQDSNLGLNITTQNPAIFLELGFSISNLD